MIREPPGSTLKVLSYRAPSIARSEIELVKKLRFFVVSYRFSAPYKLVSQSDDSLIGLLIGVVFGVEFEYFIKIQIIDLSGTRRLKIHHLVPFLLLFLVQILKWLVLGAAAR